MMHLFSFLLLAKFDEDVAKDHPGYAKIVEVCNYTSTYLKYVSIAILSACGLMMTVFAIYVGYNMATATDETKRNNSKNQLIYSIVGIAAILVLATLLHAVLPNLKIQESWATSKFPYITKEGYNKGGETKLKSIYPEFNTITYIVSVVVQIVGNIAVVFAVWVGYHLMKAEDEGKRRDAKLQIMYTILALIVIVFIQAVAGVFLTLGNK